MRYKNTLPKNLKETFYKRLDLAGNQQPRNQSQYTIDSSTKSAYNKDKWLPIARDMPFLVSHYCCNAMKKSPNGIYQRHTKTYPFIGTMAIESRLRKSSWIRHGCNSFEGNKIQSQPLSFWTEQDILQYIKNKNLEICSVYGDIVADETGKLHTTGCNRTGCIFCAYGCHREKDGDERFLRLKETHPKQYDYCINGGEWADNPYYDPNASTEPDEMGWVNWNPKKIWVPNKDGLGMGKVFDMLNEVYGENFIKYK